jgi:hypothetical protein
VVTVKLKCGVHAERESETRPIFVCHHCGMPVCEEHGWVVLADDAFDEAEEPVPRSAMHCPECAAEYHPRGAGKRRGWIVRLAGTAAGQEAPAAAQPPGYGPAVPQPQGPYPPQPAYPEPQVPYPQQPYSQQRYPQQQLPPQSHPQAPHNEPPRVPGPARDGPRWP